MRITKLGHACVRVEHDGHVVVLDPGGFTQPDAAEGATAVLITHEHFDHYAADRLAATDAPIWTIRAVADQMPEELRERTTVVAPGTTFDVGLPVSVLGEQHALIHRSLPAFANSGYLLDAGGTTLFHPGDALDQAPAGVEVLLCPVSGPWNKLGEVMDFAAAVGARRTVAIHDALFSEAGLGLVDDRLRKHLEGTGDYHRLAVGEDLSVRSAPSR